MGRIVGLGGIFYKTSDPAARKDWYVKHLGLAPGDGYDGVQLRWRRPDDQGRLEMSLVSFFDQSSDYLGDGGHPFMINFLVEGIDELVAKLRDEGCRVEGDIVRESYGSFAWVIDPDGLKIELWEPVGSPPPL